MAAVSTKFEQPTAADVGSRAPITLAGWTVEGVSVAGQVRVHRGAVQKRGCKSRLLAANVHARTPDRIPAPSQAQLIWRLQTQETCILLPLLKVAFDVGRCPQRAISHDKVFISHGHMDHIGGIPFHVATRYGPHAVATLLSPALVGAACSSDHAPFAVVGTASQQHAQQR